MNYRSLPSITSVARLGPRSIDLRWRLGADASAEQFDEPFERVVQVMGMRVSVARLEMTEAVKSTTQRAGGVYAVIVVEVKAGKGLRDHANDAFDRLFELVVASARVAIGRFVQPRVGHDGLAPGTTDRPDSLVTRHADGRLAEGSGQLFAAAQTQQAQQILIAVDMAVQRRLSHPEFLRNPGQCEGFEPFGVGKRCCSVDDSFLIKWNSCHGWAGD